MECVCFLVGDRAQDAVFTHELHGKAIDKMVDVLCNEGRHILCAALLVFPVVGLDPVVEGAA